jgi:thioredoxin-like negative regulator of GroEL
VKDGEVVDSWTGYSPRAAVKQRLEQHVGPIGA